jgi:hypothetical protein
METLVRPSTSCGMMIGLFAAAVPVGVADDGAGFAGCVLVDFSEPSCTITMMRAVLFDFFSPLGRQPKMREPGVFFPMTK